MSNSQPNSTHHTITHTFTSSTKTNPSKNTFTTMLNVPNPGMNESSYFLGLADKFFIVSRIDGDVSKIKIWNLKKSEGVV